MPWLEFIITPAARRNPRISRIKFSPAYKLIIMQINRTYGIVRLSVFLSAAFRDPDLRTKPCYLICWSFYAEALLQMNSARESRECSIFFLYILFSPDATFGESKRLSPAHFIQLLFIPCIISLLSRALSPRNSSAKICSTLSLEARPQSHCLLLSARTERGERWLFAPVILPYLMRLEVITGLIQLQTHICVYAHVHCFFCKYTILDRDKSQE